MTSLVLSLLGRKLTFHQPYQTCKRLLDVGRDRSLLLGAFDKMEQSQSLPCFRREFEDMTPIEMQRTLVAALKAEQAFLLPRKRPIHLVWNIPSDFTTIYSIDFILDRFLLTVHVDHTIGLWIVSEQTTCILYAQLTLLEDWTVVSHSVSRDRSTLYVGTYSSHLARFVFFHSCRLCFGLWFIHSIQHSSVHYFASSRSADVHPSFSTFHGMYCRHCSGPTVSSSWHCPRVQSTFTA